MQAVVEEIHPDASKQRRDQHAAANVVTGSMTMFAGQIAIKVVSFLFSVIVIRYLGSEEYGKYAVCVAFGGLFTVLSDLGLATLAVKRIAGDRSLIPSLFTNILVLRLLLAIAVVILTSIVAWIIGYSGEIRLGILIAALGLISYSFFGVADALAMGQEKFRLSTVLNVSAQVVTLVLAATLVFSGGGFLGLLGAATIAVMAVALIALRRMQREMPLRADLEPANWPELMRSAFPFAAITLALAVSYRADAVILSMHETTSVIGTYAVAYNLIFAFTSLSHSINLALFPAMTRQHASDPERSPELFRQGFRYLFFVSLPVAAFVTVNAHDIVTFLYGSDLSGAARPLAILIWVLPLMFLSEFLGYVAIVVDRERLVARANWVSTGGNVVLNLALIPIFGITAAAATTVATEVLLVGQFLFALQHTGVLADRWRTFGRTVAAVSLLAVVLVITSVFHLPIVIMGLVGASTYLLIAFIVGAIGQEEVRFATSAFRRS